jgi:ABC-type anion transport system duplicated permease subunit
MDASARSAGLFQNIGILLMATFFPKTSCSRIISPGTSYPWAGTGISASTTAGTETYHVRVISQLAGYITIGTTSDPTIATTNGVGTYIAANTASGDYFQIVPSQKIMFASTTTSSANFWNMTEMA